MSKKIILFIPSIEKGGAEKNLFIISNYLCNRFKKLTVISATKKAKKAKKVGKGKKVLELLNRENRHRERHKHLNHREQLNRSGSSPACG